MKTTRYNCSFLRPASLMSALLITAAAASAGTIYNTNSPATGFGGISLILTSSSGPTATLTFLPNGNTDTGVPSNINYGNFTLACALCPLQGSPGGALFNPFSFSLVIRDITDTAVGTYMGFSAGGTVYSDASPLWIDWAPLELGPGTTNATSGNFGSTVFQISARTRIVAPNSGAVPGQTTVSGAILGDGFPIIVDTPEPVTGVLVGGALLGLGILRSRRRAASVTPAA